MPTASPSPLPLVNTPTPTSTPAPETPASHITFYSNRDGNPEIYVMQADGSGIIRLTDDPAFDDSPALSPDGTRIAFLSARHDPAPKFPNLKYELYVVDVESGEEIRLTTTDAIEGHPAWSPDETRVSFDADYNGDGYAEIYILKPDGTGLTRLTSNPANDQFADWSPDGTQIAFASERNGNWDLFVMDADGSNQRALTDSPAWELFPAWSPDGIQIAYTSLQPNSRNTDVFVVHADGSEPRQLTETSGFDENPVWSPDGERIAFQSARGGTFGIYVMNADGSDPRLITDPASDALWPSWGPRVLIPPADVAQVTPWRPRLPEESCTLSTSRTCEVLFVLPAQYYADSGRRYPDQFRAAGYTVTVTSNAQEVVETCGNTVGPDQPTKDIPVDLRLAEVVVADYDAVVFIGGLGCQGQWHDEEAHRIAREAVAQGKVLGAAGCASTILAHAGVLQHRTAVACNANPPVKHGLDYCEVLESQGAHCSQDEIVHDELIVTARQRSRYFVAGVIELLREVDAARADGTPLSFEQSNQELGLAETFQVAMGDLDGDGDLDAVFANPMTNPGAVWLNDGSGTLVDTGQALTQYGHGVGLADFDGDGDLDGVLACHQTSRPTTVYLNDGTGTFTPSGQEFGDARTSASDLNLLDLNGDGQMDFHVLYYSPSGAPDKVYLNDGNATFTDSGLSLDEDYIAWGDLDGDGDVDYFGKHWHEGYAVGLNDGSGSFTAGWQLDNPQANVGDVALADFDGDGDLDALIANGSRDTGSQPAQLLRNDGSGSFAESRWALDKTLGSHIAVGDLDLDGRPDVFVTHRDAPNAVWLNRGDRLVDAGLQLGESSDRSGRPALGDLDGDGDLDVVVGRFEGGAQIWFNLRFLPPNLAYVPIDGDLLADH
jgi:TolB protein